MHPKNIKNVYGSSVCLYSPVNGCQAQGTERGNSGVIVKSNGARQHKNCNILKTGRIKRQLNGYLYT